MFVARVLICTLLASVAAAQEAAPASTETTPASVQTTHAAVPLDPPPTPLPVPRHRALRIGLGLASGAVLIGGIIALGIVLAPKDDNVHSDWGTLVVMQR